MHLRRTGLAISAALLAASTPAWAGGPGSAGPSWPEELSHRNARYAVLERVDDSEGDAREVFLAQAQLARVDDPAGDLEEERRYAAAVAGHWASVHARLARDLDRAGDRLQVSLARLSLARRHAQFARVRFPKVERRGEQVFDDQLELALYEYQRLTTFPDQHERVVIVEQEEDEAAKLYIAERSDHRETTASERDRDQGEDELERQAIREEVRGERERERDVERAAGEDELGADERQEEQDLERQEELDAARLETLDERVSERQEERTFDTVEERSLQIEEDGGGLQ